MGSETKNAKYWKEDEEKICRIYGKKLKDIEHVLETCERTEESKKSWIWQLKEESKTMARLKKIKWIRKQREKKEKKKKRRKKERRKLKKKERREKGGKCEKNV